MSENDKVKEAVEKVVAKEAVEKIVITEAIPVSTGSNPAIEVKRDLATKKSVSAEQVYIDSDGVQYRLVPVGSTIVQAAMEKISDPVMRTYKNPTTGKEEVNPGHPEYLKEMKEVDEQRNAAAVDAMMMFGVEIVGNLSMENTKWLDQMLFLGLIDQEIFDKAKSDEFTYEFYYKRYKLSDAETINTISSLSGVSQEAIAKAKDSFQSN